MWDDQAPGSTDDRGPVGGLVIESFDQWENPPEASAGVCWCRVGALESTAA